MQALYQCLMTDAAQMEALLAGGMETMAALISADNKQSASVQRWATKNISQLRCFGDVLFSFVYSKRSPFANCLARPDRLGSVPSSLEPSCSARGSIPYAAKSKALECGVPKHLANLLKGDNPDLQLAAANALMRSAASTRPHTAPRPVRVAPSCCT
jgi:hypothetical protein